MKLVFSLVLVAILSQPYALACVDHEPRAHKELNQILKKSGKDLDLVKVLNDLKMSPVQSADANQNLWKIDSVTKNSVFAKAGIKAGDIISIQTPEPLVIPANTASEETELE